MVESRVGTTLVFLSGGCAGVSTFHSHELPRGGQNVILGNNRCPCGSIGYVLYIYARKNLSRRITEYVFEVEYYSILLYVYKSEPYYNLTVSINHNILKD